MMVGFNNIELDRSYYLDRPGIYVIINLETGQRYVGSSVNLYKRYLYHRRKLRKGNHFNIHLQRSWSKYGADAFVFSVLVDYSAIEEVDLRWNENSVIRALDCMERGYNLIMTDDHKRYYKGGRERPDKSKPVISYNISTGEICEYPKANIISKTGNIHKAIHSRSISNGCFWFYGHEFSIDELKTSFLKRLDAIRRDWITCRNQFYLDRETGIYYQSFKSLCVALGENFRSMRRKINSDRYYSDRFLKLERD